MIHRSPGNAASKGTPPGDAPSYGAGAGGLSGAIAGTLEGLLAELLGQRKIAARLHSQILRHSAIDKTC